MRIVIDAQGVQTESRFRGIGRYTLELICAVLRNRGEHEVYIVLNGLLPDSIEYIRKSLSSLISQDNIKVWSAPGPVRYEGSDKVEIRSVAELMREAFILSLQPDIVHISSVFEGYTDDAVISIGKFDDSTPISVSLYDLIPVLNPTEYLVHNKNYSKFYSEKLDHFRRADAFLAISKSSRLEGLEYLSLSSERIVNISAAINESVFNEYTPSTEKPTCIPEELEYILYTGGADQRKNLPRLVEAWANLDAGSREKFSLVIAGKMPESVSKDLKSIARKAGEYKPNIYFTGYVSDGELARLYYNCKLFVFPSWHEGFGLPALEAMSCGAAVIAANKTSLVEIIEWPDALFDPFDSKAISEKISKALNDNEFLEQLKKNGKKQVLKFSWDLTARRAIKAWEDLHGEFSKKKLKQDTERRSKPTLAFVSPLPPERTGIADYSAELIPELSRNFNITLISNQSGKIDFIGSQNFQVKNPEWLQKNAATFDYVVYQFGNSPFHDYMLALMEEVPGVVVLHDFFLSGLVAWKEQISGHAGYWRQSLYDSHGYFALKSYHLDAELAKRNFPVNLEIFRKSRGIILHSNYSKELTREWYSENLAQNCSYVPHLRATANLGERNSARMQLEILESDFVVCSFGYLDSSKLNHLLLDAWLGSKLARSSNCRLVFVGENHGGEYGIEILDRIRDSDQAGRITISGFAPRDLFQNYLAAADMAVQLRAHSRGETSGTVLDCLAHGVPVVLNANGSMAEIDPNVVFMLPDNFEIEQLITALESLHDDYQLRKLMSRRGVEYIKNKHSPQVCADLYSQCLVDFKNRFKYEQKTLLNRIVSTHQKNLTESDFIRYASEIAKNDPIMDGRSTLFLDITATVAFDHKSGIERVVKSIITELIGLKSVGVRIEPVYLAKINRKWCYKKASRYTLDLLNLPNDILSDEIIDPRSGDVILGLDISGDILVSAQRDGFFNALRHRGVKILFVVYDLLPIQLPQVFPPGASSAHAEWISVVLTFDGAIAITETVAEDLKRWHKGNANPGSNQNYCDIHWSHLGADLKSSAPSHGWPDDVEQIRKAIASRVTFLMVGTIEPRKAYLETLKQFNVLWKAGVDVNLIVVGKEGWLALPEDMRRDIPATIEYFRSHPQLGYQFFWVDNASDQFLEELYENVDCLIAASYGEGFGLPLIEAAAYGTPIIARDIAVFREVAGYKATYFDGTKKDALSKEIVDWIENKNNNFTISSSGMPYLTWTQAAERFFHICFPKK